jgi:hypothetical protein
VASVAYWQQIFDYVELAPGRIAKMMNFGRGSAATLATPLRAPERFNADRAVTRMEEILLVVAIR